MRRAALMIVWALSAVAAHAHVGDRVLPIYELPSADLPDIHDGTLEDWDLVLRPSLDPTDLGPPGGMGDALRLEDLAWRGFLAWHNASQQLYIGMEFVDDIQMRPPDGQRWAERIDVFVDGDHSGGEFFPVYENPPFESASQAQRYEFGLSWLADVDPLVERWTPGLVTAWSLQPPWTDCEVSSYGEAPTQSVLEAIVTPWDWQSDDAQRSLRSRLQADHIIGFQIRVMDYDGANDIETYVIGEAIEGGGPTPGFWTSASYFADGLLIPCQHLDCSAGPTAAGVASWGRIKAALTPARTGGPEGPAKRTR